MMEENLTGRLHKASAAQSLPTLSHSATVQLLAIANENSFIVWHIQVAPAVFHILL